MAERKLSPRRLEFEHVPNLKRAHVVESYCPNCGLFIGASSNLKLLATAEMIHTCPESLQFGKPQE